jgi:hypothetical protein
MGMEENLLSKTTDLTFFVRGSPVRVSDGGSYICLARNDLGSSDEITAPVDVRYPARNVRTVPADFLDLEVCKKHRLLTAPPPPPTNA